MESAFHRSVLDSLHDPLCVIDRTGTIVFVNRQWERSALANDGDLLSCGVGANYLEACREAEDVYRGVSSLLDGETGIFANEYPCHSPVEKRWFFMRVSPLLGNDGGVEGAVVLHINITARKMKEYRLKKKAQTDPLTSLYNRRFFEKRLRVEMLRAQMYRRPLAILCLDIDNFKQINDTYGHGAGDQALREISRLMLNTAREGDICSRLGGDEFAILLPELDRDGLIQAAEELIGLAGNTVIREGDRSFRVGISIGGACYIDGADRQQWLDEADRALYAAKREGKNRAVVL